MQIVMLAENDPAGTAIQLKRAINNHTSHTCRLVTWETRYNCNFDCDIHLPNFRNIDFVYDLIREADVLHLHMLVTLNTCIGKFKLGDLVSPTCHIVNHHHGHPNFRANLDSFLDFYKGTKREIYVSTPDMLELFPDDIEVSWLPNLIYYQDSKYDPKTDWDLDRPLKVAHSPTRKSDKSTDLFVKTFNQVSKERMDLTLDVIEMATHLEVLRRKRNSDLVFDQMNWSFGVSSIEALFLGVPALVKLDQKQIDKVNRFAPESIEFFPWYLVNNQEELANFLQSISKEELQEHGVKVAKWMRKYWSTTRILNQISYLS